MLNTRASRNRSVMVLATLLIAGAAMLAGGCGDDDSNGPAHDPRFDPANITIVVGDTIRFVSVSGDHTVTSGTGSDDPASGQLFDADIPEGDEYLHVFNTAGTFDYYCIPHEEDGMTGRVTVTAPTAKTVDVFVSGTAFNPDVVTINPGDQIRWTVNGSHTITSGTGPTDPLMGDLFDETVSSEVFTRTFNDLGSFDYFCKIHFAMGMTAVVNVVEREYETVEVEALE